MEIVLWLLLTALKLAAAFLLPPLLAGLGYGWFVRPPASAPNSSAWFDSDASTSGSSGSA